MERWICLVCGKEKCKAHDPRDRAPLSSLGPRPWHVWMEIIQPSRVCACGADMDRHEWESDTLRLKPGQYAGYGPRRCKMYRCAASTKGAPCEGNPCTCAPKERQLSKKRIKMRMDRTYREAGVRTADGKWMARRDVVNADGDVTFELEEEIDDET